MHNLPALAQDIGDPETSDEYLTAEEDAPAAPPLGLVALALEVRPVKPLIMRKYVDDTTVVVTLPPNAGIRHVSSSSPSEQLPADEIDSLFHAIAAKAGEISMRVNCRKTQLLCISPDNGYKAWASFGTEDGSIRSQETMKLLGFMLGSSQGVTDHFDLLPRKFRARFWSLIHLRRAGIRGLRLHKLHATLIRPVLEANAVVFHPMLTRTQSDALERLQKQVFRLCFGMDSSYGTLLGAHNLKTLHQRREEAIVRFVSKAMANRRFSEKWFLRRPDVGTEIRRRRPFIEKRARTERYLNSPLIHFQQIANDLSTR